MGWTSVAALGPWQPCSLPSSGHGASTVPTAVYQPLLQLQCSEQQSTRPHESCYIAAYSSYTRHWHVNGNAAGKLLRQCQLTYPTRQHLADPGAPYGAPIAVLPVC